MSRKFSSFVDLVELAKENKFIVTSTNGGMHNKGSKHFRGLAIDVRTFDKTNSEVDCFIKVCKSHGLIVRDERRRPAGQKVWNGQHLHIEI
jgi:hypothetical protein